MPSVKFSKVTIKQRHSVFGRSPHLASKDNGESCAGQFSKFLSLTLAFCPSIIVEKKKTGDFYAAKIVSKRLTLFSSLHTHRSSQDDDLLSNRQFCTKNFYKRREKCQRVTDEISLKIFIKRDNALSRRLVLQKRYSFDQSR